MLDFYAPDHGPFEGRVVVELSGDMLTDLSPQEARELATSLLDAAEYAEER